MRKLPDLEKAFLGDGKQAQCGPSHNPEAAFGTNKQAVQSRASGRLFDRPRGDDLTSRQHGLDPEHLVPHGAVFSPQIAETIGTNRPSNGSDGYGPRIVRAHQPMGGGSLIQRLDRHSSPGVSHAVCWPDVDSLEA